MLMMMITMTMMTMLAIIHKWTSIPSVLLIILLSIIIIIVRSKYLILRLEMINITKNHSKSPVQSAMILMSLECIRNSIINSYRIKLDNWRHYQIREIMIQFRNSKNLVIKLKCQKPRPIWSRKPWPGRRIVKQLKYEFDSGNSICIYAYMKTISFWLFYVFYLSCWVLNSIVVLIYK